MAMMPMSDFFAAIKAVVNEEDVAKVVTRAMVMDANLIDSLPLPKLRIIKYVGWDTSEVLQRLMEHWAAVLQQEEELAKPAEHAL